MEAVVFTIDGQRYGVWKDQILSIEEVEALHRLPFLKSSLTVLAVIGDHTRALIELPPCLGHPPEQRNGKTSALMMSDHGQLRGFAVEAGLSSREADPAAVVALPEYLQIPFTEAFLSEDGELVPVVAVRALFEQVVKEGKAPHVKGQAVRELAAGVPEASAPFKLIVAGGFLWALQTANLAILTERPKVSRFPLIPGDIDGVAAVENHLLPVVDMPRRVSQHASGDSPCLLRTEMGRAAAVLRVDGTRGQWGPAEARVVELPPLCRKPWAEKAALHRGQIAPIIDLATLVSSPSPEVDLEAAANSYTTDSTFASAFGKETVEVYEIVAHGRRWAIPKGEVPGVIDAVPTLALAGQSGLVAGVAEHEGQLLPVLDLSRIMESTQSAATAGKMLLYANGDFEALIPSQAMPEVRSIRTSLQRDVPVSLPFPVVYGCYTEGESVRLILNVCELALHFDSSRARDLLAPLSPVEVTLATESFELRLGETQTPDRSVREEETVLTADETALPAQALEKPALDEAPAAPPVYVAEEAREVSQTVPEVPTLQAEPAAAMPAPRIDEGRSSFEEPAARKAATLSRPIHRGWRMLVAFVGSAVLIVGVVMGLHFSGLVREPQLASAPTQPQPAVQLQLQPAQPAAPQADSPQTPAGTTYVVKKGDTLWDISNRLTGNPFNYHSIAGKNRIANPDLIFPGQALQAPPDSSSSK